MRTPLLISALLFAISVHSQEMPEEIDLQQITDDLFIPPEGEADHEDIYENYVQILASPIDLNSAAAEDLRSLNILSDAQIANLISYRNDQGSFLDVHELQTIPEFDLTLIEKLLPFICVIDPSTKINRSLIQRILSPGHSYVISRYERTVEKTKGFQSTTSQPRAYQGTPDKLYLRYKNSQPGDYSLGFTGEKDAGEKLIFSARNHHWGFDHTSYHFQLQNKRLVKNVILGDFQAQFGQGIVLGSAFGLGKGGESVSTTRKSNVGFRPFTSKQESAYHRGLALTLRPFPHGEVSAFYSHVRRDAATGKEDTTSISSFQTSGYHRTQTEISNRKQVAEQNAAIVLGVTKVALQGGIIANIIRFDTPIKKAPTLYNQNSFNGMMNLNAGFYVNYTIQNISFFGETARSRNGGWASLAGLLISVHKNLEVVTMYRNFARDYHVFSSNAFSENTSPQNERGFYWGWKYQWNRRSHINGYADLFEFPWLGFRRYRPGHGYEWLFRATHKPSRKTALYGQVREENKPLNGSDDSNLYKVDNAIRRTATFQCEYAVETAIRLKTRVQYNTFQTQGVTTEGWAVVQDLSFSSGRFRVTGRHAIFSADRYDNRNYVYENDAWGSYSFPAYSGNGVRNYVLFEYKVNKSITFWFRYARTSLPDAAEMGSGQDVIEGNTRNDVKFQARLNF